MLRYIISGSTHTQLPVSHPISSVSIPPPFDSSTYYIAMSRALSLSIMKAQQIDVPRHLRYISRYCRVYTILLYVQFELSSALESLHFYSVFEKSRRAFYKYYICISSQTACAFNAACVCRMLNTLNVLHVIPLHMSHDMHKVLQYFTRIHSMY